MMKNCEASCRFLILSVWFCTHVRICGALNSRNIDLGRPLQSRNERHACRRSFCEAAVCGLGTAFGVGRLAQASDLPVYKTASDIPESLVKNHPFLYGYVERVIDGDTIRIRHIPSLDGYLENGPIPSGDSLSSKFSLSNNTIVVRMYGVDAPETAKKKGESSQPFGEEAKQLTKDLTYHKIVAVKLLDKDKYNRVLGEVVAFSGDPTQSGFTDVSLELVSRGLATIYTGVGAQYDGRRELLTNSMEAAKKSKLGMWSLGDKMISPQEYKRQKRKAEAMQS